MKHFLIQFSFVFSTAFAQFLFFLPKAHAQSVDPKIEWSQIETPHFLVIYNSKHQELAETYARFAEQAYATLTPAFQLAPRKTVLVLNDSSDTANGFAVGMPYPMIASYTVLPNSLESISDYGNWGLELITHEYVHILTFEPATGFMRPLRAVFGNIVRPNILLPRWYLEGLAVELETRYSDFGRLRSANYMSVIRSMAEDNALQQEDISRINEPIPDYPGGIRPYLFGAMVWNEMTRTKGDQIIGDLNLEYSRRIPFFINGPIENRFGVDYAGLLGKVYERAEASARKQLDIIHASGTKTEVRLEQEGFFNHSPVISPDGSTLAYIGRTHNVDSFISLAPRPKGSTAQAIGSFKDAKAKRVTTGTAISRVSWSPDSKILVYDSVDTFDRYYQYSDLYIYDLESRKSRQLTKGLRAREPVFSRDGQDIFFIQNLPGSTQLSRIAVHTPNQSQTLYTPPLQTRLSRPEVIAPDTLLFSEKRDDGKEVFKVLRLNKSTTGEVIVDAAPHEVLREFSPVHFPRLTKQGLLFVSDRSGVANVYLANAELTDAAAVTNSTTRALTGDLDPLTDELVYSRLTSKGPLLHTIESTSWRQPPDDPPTVGPLIDYQWPKHQAPQVSFTSQSGEYDPLPHLLPQYWMPFVYILPEGTYVQASTGSTDPLMKHSYGIAGGYDSLTNQPSFAVSYINQTSRVPITIKADDYYESISSGDLIRRTSSALINGSFFLPKLSEDWMGSAGWRFQQTEIGSSTLRRNGLTLGLSWSNSSQKGLEISPEKGGSFRLSHTQYFPQANSIEYEQTEIGAATYFSKGLPERHVIAGFLNATLAPKLNNVLFGTSTSSSGYQSTFAPKTFVMRGYPSGAFLGKTLVSATAEYRMPMIYSYRGFGTKPLFIQRWHSAIFVDALTLDGLAYDFDAELYRRKDFGQIFYGAGVELKADTTVFYHVPLQFIVGLHYGFDQQVGRGVVPYIGLGL